MCYPANGRTCTVKVDITSQPGLRASLDPATSISHFCQQCTMGLCRTRLPLAGHLCTSAPCLRIRFNHWCPEPEDLRYIQLIRLLASHLDLSATLPTGPQLDFCVRPIACCGPDPKIPGLRRSIRTLYVAGLRVRHPPLNQDIGFQRHGLGGYTLRLAPHGTYRVEPFNS